MRLLLVVLLLAFPVQADLKTDIDAFARRLLDTAGSTPALSVAVVEGDRIVYTGAFGLRDVEAKAPATPDTLFYIASSTKPFTAAAVRLLVADGKLDLDAPLTKSLPRLKLTPPLDASRISLRDLLAHRAGFANGAVNFRTSFPGNMDREAIFAALEQSSTSGPIEFGYSNTSYILAGLAAEEAAGMPWHELLATRIFIPLQMKSTFATIPPAGLPVAAGYVDDAHMRFRREAPKSERTIHPAGAIFTTASDLARWLSEHLSGGRVLPRRVVRDLHAPQVSLSRTYRNIDRHAYSLGWYHGQFTGDDDLLIHHFGGFNGFHAHMSFMPEHRLGVVVLSNGGGDTADLLASFIYDRVRNKPGLAAKYDAEIARVVEAANKRRAEQEKVAARKREQRPLARPASAYAGSYDSDRLGTIVVRERDGRLFAELGLIGNELLVENGDAFVIDFFSDSTLQPMRFTFNEKGGARELDWDGRKFARSPLHDRLHALLASYEQQGFSGTVLVAKDGRILLHRGYGWADRERGIRNDTDTLFEVASLNKTFTAAAILQLEARGALRTSDPLSKHLGAFPPPKDEATIHHLALHTAGLVPDGIDVASEEREPFVANVKRVAAESKPGERYRYTNAGYSVLAAIIEKASGVPYERYVRENLWKDVHFRGEPVQKLARGYDGEGKDTTPPVVRWGTRGAGGMIATVDSIYRWVVALRGGRVLDAAQTQKMFEPRPAEGYAWHVERDQDGRRMIHKGGGMPQYATQVIEYPGERIVIVWASNDLRKRWRADLNRGLADVMLRTDPAPAPR